MSILNKSLNMGDGC